jgi:hypothetical protein
MLTEEEKNEISEKETFRLAIKKSFKEQNKKKKNTFQKLTAFFNTSLGIFVLSTIFISFGSWLYTQWTAHKKITDETNKLEQEICYRLSIILKSNQKLNWDEYLDIQNSSMGFNGQPPYNRVDLSAFPDTYQKISIYSLSWQLYHYSNSKENKTMYDTILKYQKFMHANAPKNNMNFSYQISQSDSLYFEKEIKAPLLEWQKKTLPN